MTAEPPSSASTEPENDWHFGAVVLKLGFVTEEQLQEALDAQEELRAGAIQTLLADELLDLELIDREQCERALSEQDRLLRHAGLRGQVRGAPTVGWLVAGMVPFLCHLSPLAVLAWCGALLVGVALTEGSNARWVGVGWITSVLVPEASPSIVASSGSQLRGWRMPVGAVLLGPALALAPFHGPLRQAGAVLIVAALVLALARRV